MVEKGGEGWGRVGKGGEGCGRVWRGVEGCGRLGKGGEGWGRVGKSGQGWGSNQKRPIIIRFCSDMDKQSVWGAISQLTDTKVSISETYSEDTEYKRNGLYMIYRKVKSIVSRRCSLMEMY